MLVETSWQELPSLQSLIYPVCLILKFFVDFFKELKKHSTSYFSKNQDEF